MPIFLKYIEYIWLQEQQSVEDPARIDTNLSFVCCGAFSETIRPFLCLGITLYWGSSDFAGLLVIEP